MEAPKQDFTDLGSLSWTTHAQGTQYDVGYVATITDLLHRAYGPLGAAGMNYSAVDQDDSETLNRLQRGVSVVGRIGERIIATGTVYLEPVRGISETYRAIDTAHFGQFAVDPALRGKGIGNDMLFRLEDIAKSTGKTFLACDTAVPARPPPRLLRTTRLPNRRARSVAREDVSERDTAKATHVIAS